MKFGCCAGVGAQDPAKIGLERIPILKKLGFEFVELPLAQIMSLDEQAFRDGPVAMVEGCGLPCLCMNIFFPGSYRLTGPEADHDSAISYAQAAMERAARLGTKVIVLGSSGARNRPIGTSLQQGLDQMASFLSRLAPMAQSYDIVIAIEHLNRQESNLVNLYSESCALARQVNHKNVGALLDTYHMALGGEALSSVLDGGSLLRHVHVARALGRSLPCPGDEEDYPALFDALRKIGYDGPISLEAAARQDFEAEAAAALDLMRNA